MDAMRSHRSILAAVPVAVIALVALAGCVPSGTATPRPTGSASSSPTPASTATPTPGATDTPGANTPVSISCDSLITAQELYDFNPNFSTKPDYSPAAGSPAAEAVSLGGVACAWVNLTSGDTIEVSVAQPAPETLTALANDLVVSSSSVPTFGVEGYFSVASGVGVAHAFPAPFWVSASAPSFLEPGDAEPLMAAALAKLG